MSNTNAGKAGILTWLKASDPNTVGEALIELRPSFGSFVVRQMVPVESEAIDEIAYEGSTLFVRFAHGGLYKYVEVPAEVYDAFLAAESHGRFFHEHIRDRYDFRREA